MGDRYYTAMRKATGWCPGILNNKRKHKMAWEEAKKQQAIDAYEKANPTPDNSMEIVKEIAEELEESPNGVRMILTKAGVYIKKTQSKGAAPVAKEGSAKVSKAAAFEQLNVAIRDIGLEPNAEIIEKLTGKAAIYFAEVLGSVKAA
jgi:hypothetical protein